MDATVVLIAVITLAAGAVIGWLAARSRSQSDTLAIRAELHAAEVEMHAVRAQAAGLQATLEAERGAAAGREEALR